MYARVHTHITIHDDFQKHAGMQWSQKVYNYYSGELDPYLLKEKEGREKSILACMLPDYSNYMIVCMHKILYRQSPLKQQYSIILDVFLFFVFVAS